MNNSINAYDYFLITIGHERISLFKTLTNSLLVASSMLEFLIILFAILFKSLHDKNISISTDDMNYTELFVIYGLHHIL